MERPQPIELGKRVLNAAAHVGHYLLEQAGGGGWSNLPHAEPKPARPPVRANITFYTTAPEPTLEIPTNIVVGEE